MAGVPSASNSVLNEGGTSLNVAGRLQNTGGASTHENVLKHITVRDASNQPVLNSTVVINLINCVEGTGPAGVDMELGDTQPFAGLLVNCANKTVTAVTNASGIADFSVIGFARNNGLTQLSPAISDVGHTTKCAEVRADGVLLGSLNVGGFDQDGSGGVNPTDNGLLLGDRKAFLPGPVGTSAYRGRSDYDGNNAIDPVDLGLWLGIRVNFVANGGNGTSGVACAP
jgi:hypothetical protein